MYVQAATYNGIMKWRKEGRGETQENNWRIEEEDENEEEEKEEASCHMFFTFDW